MPAGGLVGQVAINTKDNGKFWLGDIEVGSTTLAPNYTSLSSELGGGATGEAPYNFHQRVTAIPTGENYDCDPYHTEQVSLGASDLLKEITISHYGPVYIDDTQSGHFRVEFLSSAIPTGGGSPQWVDRSSLFEVDTAQSGTSNATAQRGVVIKATAANKKGFKAAGAWRIRPVNEGTTPKVLCGGVDGNPAVEYDSSVVSGDLGATTGPQYDWYAFHVDLLAPGGQALLQGGNGPEASDLAAWVVEPYEVNADGDTDTDDFVDLAENYNSNP